MSLCLSQVGVLSERMDESSWFLAWEPHLFAVLKENSDIFKNKGTSFWNFVLNSGLRKFRYQLNSRMLDAQSVMNWTVIGQLS